ncbi:type II toxin-antitoxin system prevent-host-death family antitoxin [Nonomuraea angiospora]|uniref:type II toxin-antitoxin system prevent-host-death family antitoxin n=1 Tax=Nonomuraea angiospora TaxID=46172 RepID=UPI0033282070
MACRTDQRATLPQRPEALESSPLARPPAPNFCPAWTERGRMVAIQTEATRWQLQEAKQHFSEVVRKAHDKGPQIVTKHGKDVGLGW